MFGPLTTMAMEVTEGAGCFMVTDTAALAVPLGGPKEQPARTGKTNAAADRSRVPVFTICLQSFDAWPEGRGSVAYLRL
jgi:hypothetical protein